MISLSRACYVYFLFAWKNPLLESHWYYCDDHPCRIIFWLLGFEYSWPLAVVTAAGSYFPSPLLEALWEWAFIFILFHFILKKPAFAGQFASLFLIIYGTVRTLIELFIRTPDVQIWYYYGFLTQWSLLSIPMIILWGSLYYYLSKQTQK